MAMEINASGDRNEKKGGKKGKQGNERQHDKSFLARAA